MARSSLCLVLACLALVFAAASATQFRVGGQKGWSVPDAGFEPYNTWAGRMRFQIGDQLLFVYPKETDSVLLVEPAAYNACNVSSYVQKFTDGNTVFTFDRSGPFFFISGNEASCRANEKLIVVVLADRSGGGARSPPAMTPPPSSSPAPSSSPPAAAPAMSPSSPPPGAAPPVPAPAATPTTSPPSPSPAASAPAPAPTGTTPSSPPPPMAPSPSTTPTPGGSSQPPSASANAPGAGGNTTPPPPPSASGRSAAAAPAVAGIVGTLGAFIGYAMLAA